jgi:predicted outer membrane protein
MRAGITDSRLGIVLACTIVFAGCVDERSARPGRRGAAVTDPTVSHRTTTEAGGDVARDSTMPAVRWLDDANAVALVNAMNGRELAAADAELSSWHVDTIRAFAAEMAREHAAMQRSLDSAASALQIAPVAPALAALVRARMQAPIDSMWRHDGQAFDRAYLAQAVTSHQLMFLYLTRLSAIAQNTGLQQVLSAASDSVKSQLSRATALRATFAAADSAAADSTAKRAARRAARLKAAGDR